MRYDAAEVEQTDWTDREVPWNWWLRWVLPAVALWIILLVIDLTPSIVDFELAARRSTAASILDAWGDDQSRAVVSIVVDFLFIIFYVGALYLAAVWAGRQAQSHPARLVSRPMAWAAIGAGLCDMLENAGMLVMIWGEATSFWAGATSVMAWNKFTLFALSAGYSLTLAALWSLRWLRAALLDRIPARWTWLARLVAWLPQGFAVPDAPIRQRPRPEPQPGLVGICCSGGGIRSASYNLGTLQALGENGVFTQRPPGEPAAPEARYLAAVSGGGYIAGAFTSVQHNTSPGLIAGESAFAPGSPEERFLRTRTNYLARGLTGKLSALGYIGWGIIVNATFLAAVLFVLGRPIGWLAGSSFISEGLPRGYDISTMVWITIGLPAAVGTLVLPVIGRARRNTKESFRRAMQRASYLLGALAAILFLLLVLVPALPDLWDWARDRVISLGDGSENNGRGLDGAVKSGSFLQTVAGLIAATGVAGAARAFVAKQKSYFATIAAAIVVPTVLVGGFLWSAYRAGTHGRSGTLDLFGIGLDEWVWWLIVTTALAVFIAASDVTSWSLHVFYRRRLKSAYLLERFEVDRARDVDLEVDPGALRLSGQSGTPEYVACAAANVTDVGIAPPGRDAVSFTFSPTRAGIPDYATIPMTELEDLLGPRRREDVSMAGVIAMSGAAISPGMGKQSNKAISALLALFNIRLGVWLPNPLWVNRNRTALGARARFEPGWWDRPRATYLIKEMFSLYRLTDRYLYVTDGGHWENLGLVELLRRGCTEIYVLDASGDSVETFNTIGQAMALARIELGVEVVLEPDKMRLEPRKVRRKRGEVKASRLSPTDHVVGTIRWPDSTEVGHIVLCKAAVTAESPADIRFFQERSTIFPNHSTLQQFFQDEQFEAYRALGYHSAKRAHASMEAAKAEAAAAPIEPVEE